MFRNLSESTIPLGPGRLAGNAAVANLLVQRKKKPPAKASKSRYPQPPAAVGSVPVAFLPGKNGSPLLFASDEGAAGKTRVKMTGRYYLKGSATMEDPLPADLAGGPDAAVASWAEGQVREAALQALKAAPSLESGVVTGSVGGLPVDLKLQDGFEALPPFLVSGHFNGNAAALEFGSIAVEGVHGRLDLSIWITTPGKPEKGFLAGQGPRAADPTIAGFSVGGDAGAFTSQRRKNKKQGEPETYRTAGVNQQAAMAATEKWPDDVRNNPEHPVLTNLEQRSAWLTGMRSYFGNDENTINHFARIRRVDVRGSKLLLHEEAANRLEAVQKEIGVKNMPKSGGVGWPRHEAQQGDIWGTGSLHGIGYAVDYNAYETPHLADAPHANLANVLVGENHYVHVGSAASRRDPGKAAVAAFVEQRAAAIEAAKKAGVKNPEKVDWTYQAPEADQALLDKVGAEFDRVARASRRVRESLGGSKERFLLLKQRWLTGIDESDASGPPPEPKTPAQKKEAAKKAEEERAAVRKAAVEEASQLLNPWRDKIDEEYFKVDKQVRELIGHPVDDVPGLAVAGKKLAEGKGLAHGKRLGAKQRAALVDALAQFGVEAGAADDATLAKQARQMESRFEAAKGKYEWCQSLQKVYALVNDAHFVFSAKPDVRNPSASQLLESGFFTVAGADPGYEAANPNEARFGRSFFQAMVKYGFSPGSSWPHPDGMHFELRWQGPGEGGEPEAEPGGEGPAPDAGEPTGQEPEAAAQ